MASLEVDVNFESLWTVVDGCCSIHEAQSGLVGFRILHRQHGVEDRLPPR